MKILLFVLVSLFSVAQAQVTVTAGTIVLPTYLEGLPDPNPPFEQFLEPYTPSIYPYTARNSFTDKKIDHPWRTLVLENEYLKCTFLPDLGGHLYSCIDKINGQEMFYANSSIKKNQVALRGAFAALGVEFNFPVGHSWVTVSPVDFAMRHNPDGSASVVISSLDRVTGMQWRVDSTLRPALDILEQRVTLYNRADVRHRYSWWTNAAVPLQGESTTFVVPTALSATHDSAMVDTWPVSSAGVDLSVAGNHQTQSAFFAYGSKEPFIAVYQPKSRTGTIHYAEAAQLPGKKIWSWGAEAANGNAWVRKNLSDDGSSYVEIQAGLFRDQETFEFLEPQQTRSFTEYWMPARDLGGISRANLAAAAYLARSGQHGGKINLTLQVQVYRRTLKASIRILDGDHVLLNQTADLDPARNLTCTVSGLPASHKFRVQILDRGGAILLTHLEGSYDALHAGEFKVGKQPVADYRLQTGERDFLNAAKHHELSGHPDLAYSDCDRGWKQFPESVALLICAGRTSAILNRFADAASLLEQARLKSPLNSEIHYYLGIAYENQAQDQKAAAEFFAVASDSPLARAATLEAAAVQSRAGNWTTALRMVRDAMANGKDQTRAGAMEVAFLRHLGRAKEAKSRLTFWQAQDPSDLLLRAEAFQLGANDPTFLRQLSADPERVLNIASHFFALGMFEDALLFTQFKYPAVDAFEAEPGAVPPQEYPLMLYYRAYARERLGQSDFADDDRAAAKLSTLYVFPSRPASEVVLQAALRQNPDDATAHALLGMLYFSFRRTDEAVAEWQKARAIRKDLPSLQRNLGRALLELKMDVSSAVEVLQEGLSWDPQNPEIAAALKKAQTSQTAR